MSRGKHGVCFLNSFSSSNHCINAAFYLFTFFITAICKHECFSEGNVCGVFLCVLFVSFFFSHLGCSLFIYLNGACQNNPSLTKSSEDVCRRVANALLPEELSFHPLLGSQLPWPRPVDDGEQWEPGKPRTLKEDWCSPSEHCVVLCCNRTPGLVGSGWVARTFLWALFYSCPTEHAVSLLRQDCV